MTNAITQIGKYCSKTCCDEDKRTDPIARFWSYVEKSDGCWFWRGGISRRTGYGKFWIDGRTVRAHRFAYESAKGPAGKMLVCHSCDNPACVKLDHLFLGTSKDNTADMISKGRDRFNYSTR